MSALLTIQGGNFWAPGAGNVLNVVRHTEGLKKAIAARMPVYSDYGLTPRELQVLSCIKSGCRNVDIATRYHISEETVKRHLSNVFDKIGVSTRLELALFAIAKGLCPEAMAAAA